MFSPERGELPSSIRDSGKSLNCAIATRGQDPTFPHEEDVARMSKCIAEDVVRRQDAPDGDVAQCEPEIDSRGGPVKQTVGRVEFLFINAGMSDLGPFEQLATFRTDACSE